MSSKRKYQVRFNWQGEVHEFWSTAASAEDAKRCCLHRLAKKLNMRDYPLRQYFHEGRYDIHVYREEV